MLFQAVLLNLMVVKPGGATGGPLKVNCNRSLIGNIMLVLDSALS